MKITEEARAIVLVSEDETEARALFKLWFGIIPDKHHRSVASLRTGSPETVQKLRIERESSEGAAE